MKSFVPSANSMLLFWMFTGCMVVAFASEENSTFKKLLHDFNAPVLAMVGQTHALLEKQEAHFLASLKDNSADQNTNQKTKNDSQLLKRKLLAAQTLLESYQNRDHISEQTSQLFAPKLVEARVLVPEQQQKWKSNSDALINAGSSHNISEQDWLISDELPLIDLGKDFGLKPDQILLSGRVVIGQINHVGRWTSSYRSLSNPEFRCPATVLKSSDENARRKIHATGSLHGTETELCELRYLENTAPVRVGDLVILADENQRFDGSLVLGTITQANVQPNSPFWKIMVRPVKALQVDRNVLVITEEINPLRLLAN